MTEKLTWKEKYSAILLMTIGLIYLLVWIISIFSETTGFIRIEDDKLSMSKSELLSHVRTLLTIFFCVSGGMLIFRKQKTGLVFGIAVLVLFIIICCGGLYQAIKIQESRLVLFASTGVIILLTGLIFLLLPSVRKKLNANKATLPAGFGLAIALGLFYFFFQ